MHSIHEWARSGAGSEDGGEVVEHSLDVRDGRDVAVEDEILHARVDQCGSFRRASSATVLGVTAENGPAVTGGLEHPFVVGDFLIPRDSVVLGERDDDKAGLTQPAGKDVTTKVPVDEKRGATRVAVKRLRCGHVKRSGDRPPVCRTHW